MIDTSGKDIYWVQCPTLAMRELITYSNLRDKDLPPLLT
jgi:hypothetical protein